MLKARLRNVLGVRAADFAIPQQGILLIAGANGAGKSSILEAVRCAALGVIHARGTTTKKGAATLLHDGAEAGSASLDWGTGQIRVSWPDGGIETQGQPREFGTHLGIGALSWHALKPDTRAAEFAARFGAEPTEDDFAAFLRGRDDLAPEHVASLAAQMWEKIGRSGWDATHAAAKEKATKLRGQWEMVAKVRWGDQRAPTWRPSVLLPDEVYDSEAIQADLKAAREALADISARGVVNRAEVARLTPIALERGQREKAAETARAESRAADSAAESILRRQMQLPATEKHHKCPHCGGALHLGRTANSDISIVAPKGPGMTEGEMQRVAAERQALSAGLVEANKRSEAAREAAGVALAALQESVKAQKRLDEIAAMPEAAPDQAVGEAQLLVASLEERLAAVRAMEEARAIYSQWALCQPLIAALAPDGVRKTVASRALEKANAELAVISQTGQWPEVTLGDDLLLAMGGRPYGLLSESEQWRADATLALVLAKREGAALITLDRLDVLESSRRGAALRAVLSVGIPALVACTAANKLPADDPKGTLPRLRQAGAGAVMWAEGGTLEELPW